MPSSLQKPSSNSVVIKSIDREGIKEAVKAYVARLRQSHPEIEQAIWFGSWINGFPAPGSDVDLCIILSASDKPRHERLPDYLPVGFPVGIDLFIYTREEFNRLRAESPGWFAEISSGVTI
jgi:predicted nucleotidyltransferase